MAYTTIHTTYALGRIASAIASGVPINLTGFAVGDGGGSSVTPDPAQTALVNERWRTSINTLTIDPSTPNKLIIEAVVPAATGGWTIREFGVLDDAGRLFSLGNFPATYKTVPSDGATNDLVIRVEIIVSNASVISLIVDPSVAVATQAWVVSNINVASLIPGGTTHQVLRKRTNTSGDVEWADPATVSIIVDALEEQQAVAPGQLTFNLSTVTTVGLAVYVEGVRLPKVAGATGWQQGTSQTQVVLGKQYPVGSVVTFVQNEPAGVIGNPLQAGNNLSDVSNVALARSNLDVYSRAETDQLCPPGTIIYVAGLFVTPGFLTAAGGNVSRTVYARLYARIGTTYGAGDGFTTFGIPDLRGVFVRGLDMGRGLDPGRNTVGSYQPDTLASHSHGITIPFYNEAGAGALASGNPAALEGYYTQDTGFTGYSETRPKNIGLIPLIKY